MTNEEIAALVADPRVQTALQEAVTAGIKKAQVKTVDIKDGKLDVNVKHSFDHVEPSVYDYALDVGKTALKCMAVGAATYVTVWGIAKLLGPAVEASGEITDAE